MGVKVLSPVAPHQACPCENRGTGQALALSRRVKENLVWLRILRDAKGVIWHEYGAKPTRSR